MRGHDTAAAAMRRKTKSPISNSGAMKLLGFLPCSFLFLLAFCAAQAADSPVTNVSVAPEAAKLPVPAQTQPALQTETPANGMSFEGRQFDWNTATMVHPSIFRTSFSVDKPRLMKGSCARVDLSNKSLRFLVTGRDKDWGQPMPEFPERDLRIRTRRQSARDFILDARKPVAEGGKGLNMLLAVNCTPWSPWEAPWNHKYADKTGLIISDGVMVAPVNGNPSFIVYKDGRVEFHSVSPKEDLSAIQHAVTGFNIVLADDEITAKNEPASLAPRTGFGLSKDKKFLYLFVVDGRQPKYSMGANLYEVAEWLQYFGACSGMNMDGGGSTTLFCWDAVPDPDNTDPNSKDLPNLHKLNHQPGNTERTVACTLGIYLVDKK